MLDREDDMLLALKEAVSAFLLLAPAWIPTPTFAWGNEGQRITRLIAFQLLIAQTRVAINRHLPRGDLAQGQYH
jgi:hypothetical protein